MKQQIKKRLLITLAVLLFAGLLLVEIFHGSLFDGLKYGESLYSIATRFMGGVACMIFIYLFSSSKMLSLKTTLKAFAVFLPCMAVAVNNFPFIPFFRGEAYIDSSAEHIIIYALLCLCVGFFEEMAFRGCIFTVILQRRGKRWIDVFVSIVLSSLIFGAVHLVNIFTGASVGAVILQVGYSFLIGGMCSVILIKTGNIWYCVFLHAVYNFAGGVVPECGGGEIWTAAEIVLTASVAVLVASYVIYRLIKIKPREIESLLNERICRN